MTCFLQDEGQGGTGPSGIQCLKQNVRERKKAATDPCVLRLRRKHTDVRLCEGHVRARRSPGAGDGMGPAACSGLGLHGPAALALGAPSPGGGGEACSDAWAQAGGEPGMEEPCSFLLRAAAPRPGGPPVPLWRPVLAWGPLPFLTPWVCPDILPLLVPGHCPLWSRHHYLPLSGTRAKRRP